MNVTSLVKPRLEIVFYLSENERGTLGENLPPSVRYEPYKAGKTQNENE